MAQTYLIFDFGGNEDSAQQARLQLDRWRQAFHLINKLEHRFERKAAEKSGDADQLRVIVRLDFSDHEKLSYHRWLDRIPSENLFKEASPKIVHHGEPGFEAAEELFDSVSGKKAENYAK
jgi:hypothetical protein